MLSVLPVSTNDIPIIPVEIFEERICNVIEEKTGKRLTIGELRQMDTGDIERILKIKATWPKKIRRNDPSSLYKFRSPKRAMYNRAVINGLLMKEN